LILDFLFFLLSSLPNNFIQFKSVPTNMANKKIIELLGDQADYYLNHTSKTFAKETLHLPNANTIDNSWIPSNRNNQTLNSINGLLNNGRLAGTGYVSILPVDQGIEHSAGASFSPNPIYFDPENIVKLAIEGGCNAVCSTFGVLGSVARKYTNDGKNQPQRVFKLA
jgi:fructose-bisphosphate aldolase, class I